MTLPARYIGGLPFRRLGASLPIFTALSQAQTDLANQVSNVIAAGDTYLKANETSNALSSYQAAGQAGATSVGPEIDLSGLPNITQPYTQQAWTINGTLSKETDANKAQSYVKMMESIYKIALARAIGVASDARPGTNLLATPAQSIGISSLIVGTLFAGLVAGVVWQETHR